MAAVRITDLRVRHDEHGVEVSALIDEYRLWFLLPPAYEPANVGDAFLACGLVLAMFRREPLEIDPAWPISRQLFEKLNVIQEIYHSWNPDLAKIEVRCTVCEPPPARPAGASFFSAGVDSLYTLLRRREEIEYLLFICGGFEMRVDDIASRIAEYADIATLFQKRLVPVQTNIWGYKTCFAIDWSLAQSFGLYAVAHLLGFERTFIGASFTYSELFPWGSHPLVDPLWSNGATALVHDGAGARRSEKIRLIASKQEWLAALRVCWLRPQGNCGSCPKCARTMLTLELLGLRSDSFPPLTRAAKAYLRPTSPSEETFLLDNLALALEVGNRDVARFLRRLRVGYQVRRALLDLDRRFCGSRLRWAHASLFRRFLPSDRILVAVPPHEAGGLAPKRPWLPPSPKAHTRL